MTIEELHNEIAPVLKEMDQKLDKTAASLERHEVKIVVADKRIEKAESRIDKLERWMWFTLGAGGAAGAGLVKLLT